MKTIGIKYLAYILSVLGLLNSGCKKDWLDEKSDRSLTVPSSLSDFQGLLDNVSNMSQQYPILGDIAADGFYVTDAVYQTATKNDGTDAYIWHKTVPHDGKTGGWNTAYNKVLVDNIVLDGLEKIKPGPLEQEQWNDIKGQALFNRARIFFELAQIYTVPYNAATAEQDLGIVLRVSEDITIPSKRSTIKQTYDQILKDLKEARTLLPVRPKILTRASASATNALLARIYLSMADYENALLAADNCLKQYNQLLDYNDVLPTASFIGLYNKEVLLHNNFLPTIYSLTSNLIDQSLFDLYLPNDLRRSRFYTINTNSTITFKGNYENVTFNLFCGLATDEVYLTRAECFSRTGKINEALKDLNDLLSKRWDKNVSYPAYTSNNAEDVLRKILLERKKELILRGVRWMDLRRLNKDPRFAVTLKRTVLGIEYTLEPNSERYALPIPDDIVTQTGIRQNPGWP
jgi:tetratricopeptide (TPR) repeat protein